MILKTAARQLKLSANLLAEAEISFQEGEAHLDLAKTLKAQAEKGNSIRIALTSSSAKPNPQPQAGQASIPEELSISLIEENKTQLPPTRVQ